MGVSVEGELGAIGGTEDGLSVSEEDAMLADPDEAIYFWNETKVDAMAIAVGTAHGIYKKEPKIQLDNIHKVAESIGVSVVLHGGSGVPDQQIVDAISMGVGKINVNTESCVAYTNAVHKYLQANPDAFDPRAYQGAGREAMKNIVRNKMQLFGSNSKV
ncbi:class II fructose-bisphosphate aldolase [Salipaludibacillus neizhouensis]|uniref:class II fructose-bisphosphate aldolase n=1 Tax=Salipaludibacillus neizhouensis TaxID=885475 RepID=UPI00217CE2ED|nr:class II fructose-bisphosphate aldolase [Salipaludibacillus neizhouensis]